MKHISELRTILSHFFDWHKCRLDCLGQIIQALFVVRTINLTQVASAFKTRRTILLMSKVKPVKNRQTLRYDGSSLTSDLKAEATWVRFMVLMTNRA